MCHRKFWRSRFSTTFTTEPLGTKSFCLQKLQGHFFQPSDFFSQKQHGPYFTSPPKTNGWNLEPENQHTKLKKEILDSKASLWLNQPILKNMQPSNLDHFLKFRGEYKKPFEITKPRFPYHSHIFRDQTFPLGRIGNPLHESS